MADRLTYSITVHRGIDSAGRDWWRVDYVNNIDLDDLPPLLDGLGMLEAAKLDLMQQTGALPQPDTDDT